MGAAGINMPFDEWVHLNRTRIFEEPTLRADVAPFPPAALMQDTAAVTTDDAFARQGTDIYKAVAACSPVSLNSFASVLDFGCGCARLGRMFLGTEGSYTGCDIDGRHVDWINQNLTHMRAVQTVPNEPLPFEDDSFDAIISISVFTHITEESQFLYLSELSRIAKKGAFLFLSVHGEAAMKRVNTEEEIFRMIGVPEGDMPDAASRVYCGLYAFIKQGSGHPTEKSYDYGITFTPSSYVERTWSRYFDVVNVAKGAIQGWQDIVVCRKR